MTLLKNQTGIFLSFLFLSFWIKLNQLAFLHMDLNVRCVDLEGLHDFCKLAGALNRCGESSVGSAVSLTDAPWRSWTFTSGAIKGMSSIFKMHAGGVENKHIGEGKQSGQRSVWDKALSSRQTSLFRPRPLWDEARYNRHLVLKTRGTTTWNSVLKTVSATLLPYINHHCV